MNSAYGAVTDTIMLPHLVRLARRGQFAEAERGIAFLVDIEPSAVNLMLQGRVYAQQGKYDDALKSWQRVLQLDPRHSEALDASARAEKLISASRDPVKIWRFRLIAGSLIGLAVLTIALLVTFRPVQSDDETVAIERVATDLKLQQSIDELQKSFDQFRSRTNADVMMLNSSIQGFMSDMNADGSVIVQEPSGAVYTIAGVVPTSFLKNLIMNYVRARTNSEYSFNDQVEVTHRYRIRQGDEGLVIATRLFGDNKRWGEIFDLNRDMVNHSDSLVPGSLITLPEN